MYPIVTGATGTIGSHFSNRCTKSKVDLLNISGTIGDSECYLQATIIHLAGIVGPTNVVENLERSRKINVTKTIVLAEKLLELGISKFVFASTSHVYAKSDAPVSEEALIEPQNLYAEQKIETEIALRNLFFKSTAELTIVRIFSVLDWDCKDFTLGGLFRRIAAGDTTLQIRNGDDERDFLTPKSIAERIEAIAIKDGMSGIWNLSSGNSLTVREAATRMLSDVIGESLIDRIVPGRSDSPRIIGNNQKLRNALPEVDFSWVPSMYKTISES